MLPLSLPVDASAMSLFLPARLLASTDSLSYVSLWDKFYGPYTVREDETAIPQDSQLGSDAVGLEVYCGDELLFRGAALDQGGLLWLYNEDGSIENFGVTAILSSGVMIDNL